MTITFKLDYLTEKAIQRKEAEARRTLREMAGVRLSAREAREVMPSIQNHKWYISERVGRDVGLRVAAIDYFDNIYKPRAAERAGSGTLTQKLKNVAKDLGALYLAHQSWKAHDALFHTRPGDFQ
ncbi:MAG TPA: DUF4032 domain-containing protein [Pyrinomonadaceae bacterium]|jgi:hypothetical protein